MAKKTKNSVIPFCNQLVKLYSDYEIYVNDDMSDTNTEISRHDILSIASYIVDSAFGSYMWCTIDQQIYRTKMSMHDIVNVRFFFVLLCRLCGKIKYPISLDQVFMDYVSGNKFSSPEMIKDWDIKPLSLMQSILGESQSLYMYHPDHVGFMFEFIFSKAECCREIACNVNNETHGMLPAPQEEICKKPEITFQKYFI